MHIRYPGTMLNYAETLSVKTTRTLLSVKLTLSIVIVCYTVSVNCTI